MRNVSVALALVVISMFGALSSSKGALVLRIEESGSNVKATYNGTLDLTGINMKIAPSTVRGANNINPGNPSFFSIPGNAKRNFLDDNPWKVAPTPFGTDSRFLSNSVNSISDEDAFGFFPNTLYVHTLYSSGDPLFARVIFRDTDFDDMGLIPGTQTAELTNGDTLEIQVSQPQPDPIPEPKDYGLILGVAGLTTAIFLRRRRRSNAF